MTKSTPRLTTDNTIFYSTANAGYATYAAVSLLTVRDHLPNAKLYVLSSGLSDYDRKLLDKHDIGYHEVDLSDAFNQTWEYPIDCFYLFAGPELFYRQGYEYSVYMDGDILCASNPLMGISDIHGVASAEQGDNGASIFGDDIEKIRNTWKLTEDPMQSRRINTGTVYFNNQRMVDVQLFSKASDLFKESIKQGIPRKGDDSLFSLFRYVYLSKDDVQYLSSRYNYVLQYNELTYPVDGLVFFHFSIEKPWRKRPYSHNNPALSVFDPYVKTWRQKFRKTTFGSWVKSVRLLEKICSAVDRVARGVRKLAGVLLRDPYLWAMGLKRSILERRRNTKTKPLQVYWWRDFDKNTQNFGDEITKDIIYKLIGYRSDLVSPDDAELFGVGSILETAQEKQSSHKLYVWGSGFIQAQKSGAEDVFLNTEFNAVRGYKTRQRVESSEGTIGVGDPGLLARLVYKPSRYRTHKIGVVAHYADADLPILKQIKNDDRFLLINPLQSPGEVARLITSCRLVLSSSLHGLIFADSYGVPNIHLKLSDRLKGGIYKFEDYYSTLNLDYRCADLDMLYSNEYHNKLVSAYRQPDAIRRVQRNLLKTFPKLR